MQSASQAGKKKTRNYAKHGQKCTHLQSETQNEIGRTVTSTDDVGPDL